MIVISGQLLKTKVDIMSYIKSKENDMKTCSALFVGVVLFMGVSCQQRPTALTDAQKAEVCKERCCTTSGVCQRLQ